MNPSQGATETWGALPRTLVAQAWGKEGLEVCSVSTHLPGAYCIQVLTLMARSPLPPGQQPWVLGSPSLCLAPTPHRSRRGEPRALTFQAGQLEPHVGASAAWERGEACFASATRGQAPTLARGTTGRSGGGKPQPTRSRRLQTSPGLHLLCAEWKNCEAPQKPNIPEEAPCGGWAGEAAGEG